MSLVFLLINTFHAHVKGQNYQSFILEFYKPSAEMEPYAALIMESGIIQEVVTDLEDSFILPKPVTIVFASGIAGPQYYQGVINMPYEFLFQNYQILIESGFSDDADELAETILDLTEFVLYHEVGHALVDILDVPVLGKEEDAVDGFAAILATIWDLDDVALAAADVFDASTALKAGSEFTESAFWDSHSLSEQRMYSIFCLIYGSDPNEHYSLLQDIGMPQEQSSRCQYEYQKTLRNWTRMFGEYVNPQVPGVVKYGPGAPGTYGPGATSGWVRKN